MPNFQEFGFSNFRVLLGSSRMPKKNDEDDDEKKGFLVSDHQMCCELSGFPESPDWLFDSAEDKEGIKFGPRHIHNSPIRHFIIPTINAMTKPMIRIIFGFTDTPFLVRS